jgi:phosphoglycolate phosphatase-like HAD superfamily hydrolase
LKQFFDFKTSIDSNVVARIFEEFFCGPELFTKSYGMQPRFNKKQQGLIDNEHLIITSETLSLLSAILGSSNLGIASGSGADQANYILGDLLRSFRSEALVFRETVEEAMRGAVEKGGMVSLLKPHPFSLLRTAQALEPFGRILCVGDSMEDAKMVEKALERDDRFSFAAVYSYSAPRDAALESLLEYGCDWVLPSVNELPKLLRAAWRNLT